MHNLNKRWQETKAPALHSALTSASWMWSVLGWRHRHSLWFSAGGRGQRWYCQGTSPVPPLLPLVTASGTTAELAGHTEGVNRRLMNQNKYWRLWRHKTCKKMQGQFFLWALVIFIQKVSCLSECIVKFF